MNVLQGAYDVRDEIAKHLVDTGRKSKWLADKIGVSPTHLGGILKKERSLTDALLVAINEALHTQFSKEPPASTPHDMRKTG